MIPALYVGSTTHHRFEPRPHRFRYAIFQLLVDVDDPGAGLPGLMRLGRFGLFSFTPADHGDRSGAPLRAWVEARLAEAGVTASAVRIRLLAFPRVLGFVFNPLSLFFVEDTDGRLEAVIYEVNNTFGQTHAYVVPAAGAGRQRQAAAKRLYVSPFYGVEGEYRFTVTPPDEGFHLTIVKAVNGRTDFTAAQTAQRVPLSNPVLLKLFFSMPLMTLKVVAAIHWEALRLLIKGAPFGARPPGPDVGASLGQALVRSAENTHV
ncbi:DUF1365 family protein [Caulobacter ginsengisoli]|uniref:DUF1365 family protein n=1 Tax=Caulobacter ginsengisoli TaxID=400775 RepID=A0ABU0IMD0_9CAUL|nr:DUF1365 domain-containing protein [Caulobacter ginsengisoli]MDQ0463181.1 DUF1365 family protein [Caulobacter ginsengisoli]